jgi:hypothetical protein
MVDSTMRDRLNTIPLNLYRERYPTMKSLDQFYGPPGAPPIKGDAFKGVPPEHNSVIRNICAGKWLRTGWHTNPDMLVISANLTNVTSWLPTNGNSVATSFEPANTIGAKIPGFERIPVEKIGLRERLHQ